MLLWVKKRIILKLFKNQKVWQILQPSLGQVIENKHKNIKA